MRVRKSDAARVFGVSKARITQLVAKGLPVGTDGKLDLDEARRWMNENIDPSRRESWYEARGLERPQIPDGAPDPFAPALAFEQPGHRGFALAALTAIYETPMIVACAVAEAGGTREMAERMTDFVTLALWQSLDEGAKRWHLPAVEGSGEVIVADQEAMKCWPERVNWRELYQGETS